MQKRPAGSVRSNCGASRRMSVHDAFTKHEAFERSALLTGRTTRSRCPTSDIGGNDRSTVATDLPSLGMVGSFISKAVRDITHRQKSEFLVHGRDDEIRSH